MKTSTHIVIKRKDVCKYLSNNQIKYLDAILNTIADGRKKDGKKPVNSYYICNTDESYADEVLAIILKAESEVSEQIVIELDKDIIESLNDGVGLSDCQYKSLIDAITNGTPLPE